MLKNKSQSYIYAALSILFWATAASAFKLTLSVYDNHIASVLMVSSWCSLFVLLLLLLIHKKSIKSCINKTGVFNSALLGLLNPFIYYLILFKAYSILPGQEAQPLNFIWPIVLSLLSVLILKERFSLAQAGAFLISFIGVFIITTRGHLWPIHVSDPLGASLALGSTIVWAFYWILNMKDRRDVLVKLTMNFFFGSIYITIYVLMFNLWHWSGFAGLAGCLWIGLFEMGITFFCWLKALELASNTTRMSQLIYLTPFFSMLLLSSIVKENIQLSSIVGLCLIVLGVFLEHSMHLKKS